MQLFQPSYLPDDIRILSRRQLLRIGSVAVVRTAIKLDVHAPSGFRGASK